MRRVFIAVAGLLLLCSPSAVAQTELMPGQLATRQIPTVSEPVVFNGEEGYFVDVPSDATRIVLELTTSPPQAAVDLYATFGEDVRVTSTGEILADFISQGPTGLERIEITPVSSPPLMFGRYFVAISAGADNVETIAFLRVVIDTVILTDVIEIVKSDFATGTDGWQRNYPAPEPEVPSSTLGEQSSSIRTERDEIGDRSRYLQIEADGNDFFVAGPQFLGNLALLGDDARIEFDLRYRPPQSFANQSIEIKIFGRFTVYLWSGGRPNTEFTHYSVPLFENSWRRISGSSSFEETLRNVLRIEVRANYGQVGGLTDLDNFAVFGRAMPPLVPLLSAFDTSFDGWIRNFPEAPFLQSRAYGATVGDQETTMRIVSTDGNPGGYLQITDDSDDENQDFVLAPPVYLGDFSQLGPNAAFEFDRRHSSGFSATRPVEIRIIGFGAAYRFSGPLPTSEWIRYSAPLVENQWTAIAGTRSFEQVLRAVQRIEVSVDDAQGGEINSLDNFRLVGTPTDVPELSSSPDSLSFVSVIGGETPMARAVQITSDSNETSFSADVVGNSPWIDIQVDQGSTPGVLVVGVNPAGLARRTYTGAIEVLWAGAPEPLTIDVRLTVINPTTPVISSGGVVNNATYVSNDQPAGELSGGMFVAIFGERMATGSEQASTVPFPGSLAGTSVTMGGSAMPLVYVSPTQIVGVVPQALTQVTATAQTAPETEADVVVIHDGDESPIETVRLKPVQPLIFTQNQAGTGLGSIQNVLSNGGVQLNTFDTPVRPGQTITIFTTGLGATETPVPDGFAASGVNRITGQATVTIGGITIAPSFAGLRPTSPLLYQVNATVPIESPTGCGVPVRISVDGVTSNEVTLAVTVDGAPCR